ncbi:MAG: efflux RND transporter periplasmic adaptor subunit [Deltaproteobacteria bacterium]
MKKKRKTALAVLLLAVLIGAWYAYQRLMQPANGALRTTGTVEGTEVNITSKINGRLARLTLVEGDTVHAGQVVAKLDDADLAAEVRSAAAALDKAKAGVKVAEATLEDQRAGLESAKAQILEAEAEVQKAAAQGKDAERHLSQMTRLYKGNSVARESFDAAVTAKESAVAAQDAAHAQLEAAKAGRRAMEAQLKMAESQLSLAKAVASQSAADLAQWQAKYDDTIIKSPITGTVVYKALEQGETATPGQTILTIINLDRLTVRVDIDESKLGFLHIGDKADLRATGNLDKSIPGHIAAINRYADFATQKDVTGGREDIRTFRVTIAVDEPHSGLLPGMTVKVTIPNHASEARNAG